ncbi:hypothetical protein EV191_1285 [Tamaricihabitans halophyticus]|uniref:VOC domain-containing protein n=1 Tax=Tamaricihabitans halophyticus TaxID=1262583 RepID=A0A4R2Q297_9PSEU|nr:VOC family protein [Tamaricihabitans halophyticus]TCP40755.1 hypothetical protein EV191_1285 [Tamaricihabitans halophyticus]
MTAQLNHTIVRAHDKWESARHLADLLALPEPTVYGPFVVVQTGNGVSLDYADDHGTPDGQHYAFIVTEAEFDEIHARIRDRNIPISADPLGKEPGVINTRDGGRGLYWKDPAGHDMEIITQPYGAGD